jgi:hypothetical protein
MGRRTSGQQVGFQAIGNVQANQATLTTTQSNQDLTLDPNGTGAVLINGDVTIANQGDLRLREASGNGTNYIAMQAAATMAADYTITWPAAVSGTNGFFLASDTSGNLSWTSAAGNIAVSDPGSTATVHYPFFGTNSGSLPSTLSPQARSNLAFVPSTGELLHPILSGASTNSATLTIRGTSSATKATASVLMNDGVASTSTTTGTLVVTGGVGLSGRLSAASAVVEGTVNALRSESTSPTTNYTLALTDRDAVVVMNNTGGATVTVPPNSSVAFPIGSIIYISRINTGTVTLAAGVGVSLSKTGTMAQYEEIAVRKRGSDSWAVIDFPTAGIATASGGTGSVSAPYTISTFTTTGAATYTVA